MQDYRRDHEIEATWPVAERILVCVRPNPESDRLVRAARRMAARLRAEWIVAYVESPAQPPLSPAERERPGRAPCKLAEELGAETAVLSGDERERGAPRLRAPAQRQPDRRGQAAPRPLARPAARLARWTRSSAAAARSTSTSSPASARRRGRAARPPRLARAARPCTTLWSAAVVAGLHARLLGHVHGRFDNSNLVMVYLLGVAFVATRFGRGASALAAVLSVAAFDFFFVPPHLTFAVADTQYVVTFARDAGGEPAHQHARGAGAGPGRGGAAAGAADAGPLRDEPRPGGRADGRGGRGRGRRGTSAEVFGGRAAVLLPGADGRARARERGPRRGRAREGAVAQWAFDHGQPAGLGTDTLPGAAAVYVPLRGTQSALGVLGVRPAPALLPLPAGPDRPARDPGPPGRPPASSGSGWPTRRSRRASRSETERLRSTLLSSVSHDLRTPLAAITGAASSLLQDDLARATSRGASCRRRSTRRRSA